MNRANELLQVAFNAYAPLAAQKEMIKLLTEMEEENEPAEAIAVTIAHALIEGLQLGNQWRVMMKKYAVEIGYSRYMISPVDAMTLFEISQRLVPLTCTKDYRAFFPSKEEKPFVLRVELVTVLDKEPEDETAPTYEQEPEKD